MPPTSGAASRPDRRAVVGTLDERGTCANRLAVTPSARLRPLSVSISAGGPGRDLTTGEGWRAACAKRLEVKLSAKLCELPVGAVRDLLDGGRPRPACCAKFIGGGMPRAHPLEKAGGIPLAPAMAGFSNTHGRAGNDATTFCGIRGDGG